MVGETFFTGALFKEQRVFVVYTRLVVVVTRRAHLFIYGGGFHHSPNVGVGEEAVVAAVGRLGLAAHEVICHLAPVDSYTLKRPHDDVAREVALHGEQKPPRVVAFVNANVLNEVYGYFGKHRYGVFGLAVHGQHHAHEGAKEAVPRIYANLAVLLEAEVGVLPRKRAYAQIYVGVVLESRGSKAVEAVAFFES